MKAVVLYTSNVASQSCASSRVSSRQLLALLIVVGSALDFFRLGAQPIWYDEALSISIAHLPRRDFIKFVCEHEPFMLLYYILLRGWIYFGDSAFAVRSLSAIFSTVTIPLFFLLVQRLFDRRTAVIATSLLCANSLFVQYAQEARAYALTVLLTIGSWLLLLKLLDRLRWQGTARYSLVTAGLAYSQALALLTLPAQWIATAMLPKGRDGWKLVTVGTIAMAVMISPLLYLSAHALRAEIDWIPRPEVARELHQTVVRFLNLPRDLSRLPHNPILLLIMILAVVALPTYGLAINWSRMNGERRAAYICLAVCAFLPPLSLIVISLVIHPVYLIRYILPSLPFFLALLAGGTSELPSILMMASATVLLVINVLGTVDYFQVPIKPDWTRAIDYLASETTSGDRIAIAPVYECLPFDYNLRHTGEKRLESMMLLPNCASILGSATSSPMPAYSRVWVVSEPSAPDEKNLSYGIDARDACQQLHKFNDLNVSLCVQKQQRP